MRKTAVHKHIRIGLIEAKPLGLEIMQAQYLIQINAKKLLESKGRYKEQKIDNQ